MMDNLALLPAKGGMAEDVGEDRFRGAGEGLQDFWSVADRFSYALACFRPFAFSCPADQLTQPVSRP
jgi:hypothetical protein